MQQPQQPGYPAPMQQQPSGRQGLNPDNMPNPIQVSVKHTLCPSGFLGRLALSLVVFLRPWLSVPVNGQWLKNIEFDCF